VNKKELQKIVDSLPKASDGTVLYPGVNVYWWDDSAQKVFERVIQKITLTGFEFADPVPVLIQSGHLPLYGTREGAIKYRKELLEKQLQELDDELTS
jgi:hypothetical protein